MINDLTIQEILIAETCCVCGEVFGITSGIKNSLLESHDWFYCPRGHKQYYTGENKDEQLKRERAEKEKLLRELKAERDSKQYWQENANMHKLALRSTRGVVTKLKNRSQAGMCQCCKRTFQNVQKHYKTKHPDYARSNPNE